MKYTKSPKTAAEHCQILQERGLIITDIERATKYLKSVGYFRLTGYMFHLQSRDGNHQFIKETTFEEIIKLYQFDKINDEIRASFANQKEPFLKKFSNKYVDENIPPSNMALETLSLGKLARLYKALKNQDGKAEIAQSFGLPTNVLTSWIIYLANVRNICAHHARLWNKKVTVDRPLFPHREKYKFKGENFTDSNTTLYGIISIIDRLLTSFNPENSFTIKIENLISEYSIDCHWMGFPANWMENANWKVK